jgi:hypothetical protein
MRRIMRRIMTGEPVAVPGARWHPRQGTPQESTRATPKGGARGSAAFPKWTTDQDPSVYQRARKWYRALGARRKMQRDEDKAWICLNRYAGHERADSNVVPGIVRCVRPNSLLNCKKRQAKSCYAERNFIIPYQ